MKAIEAHVKYTQEVKKLYFGRLVQFKRLYEKKNVKQISGKVIIEGRNHLPNIFLECLELHPSEVTTVSCPQY